MPRQINEKSPSTRYKIEYYDPSIFVFGSAIDYATTKKEVSEKIKELVSKHPPKNQSSISVSLEQVILDKEVTQDNLSELWAELDKVY